MKILKQIAGQGGKLSTVGVRAVAAETVVNLKKLKTEKLDFIAQTIQAIFMTCQ